MLDRDAIGLKAQARFEELWRASHWELDSALDRRSRAFQLNLLNGRRYARALEIGCGAGAFTELLAPFCDRLVAIDIAPSAIERARKRLASTGSVEWRTTNVVDFDPRREGPWDLVVMSETIYCLGWLYPLFDIGWLAEGLFDATSDGGRLLMADTYGTPRDYLLRPWLIDTYRDLLRNVGYGVEVSEILAGEKNGVEFRILVTLFAKPAGADDIDP